MAPLVQEMLEKREQFERIGYHMSHAQVALETERLRMVGSRQFRRPLDETFHEFLINHLLWVLGEHWTKAQEALPEAERHFIMRCLERSRDLVARSRVPENLDGDEWGAVPDGWTKSLFALALDVYSILHSGGQLTKVLLTRLKSRLGYQGARYEILVAGLLSRIGCRVLFQRESAVAGERRCDLLAFHRPTETTFAVEVKSRHRPGVLDHPGHRDEERLMHGEVRELMEQAIGQAPGDSPFLIFIDVNAPMLPSRQPRWVTDVERIVKDYAAIPEHIPLPFSAIFVTNYGFHYAGENEVQGNQYLAVHPGNCRESLPDPAIFNYLKAGLDHYGEVPRLP